MKFAEAAPRWHCRDVFRLSINIFHAIGVLISSAMRARSSFFLILVPDIGQSSTKRT